MPHNHHFTKFLLALLVIFSIIILLSYIEPTKIIEALGIKNVYLVVFFLAIIGGVSALTAAGFYATLFSLTLGGADPFIIAAFSAPGVLIGDLIFWYLGTEGKIILKEKYSNLDTRFSSWLSKKSKWFVSIVIYIYTGFTPLPGDFLMVTLAVIGIRFKQIIIPTILGNYTLALIVSLSAKYSLTP